MTESLAFIGKIISVEDIPGADRIKLVTAVCGRGGKWKSIMPIQSAIVDSLVVVFQPDSILPSTNPAYAFMAQYKYRVKQCQFKGVPSESLIMPITELFPVNHELEIGNDITELLEVTKYEKPDGGERGIGDWPPFLRKTDEPNFQRVPEMVAAMNHMEVKVTLKMDGSSTTVYNHLGEFGVCSRNLKVKEGDNRYWIPVHKYDLKKFLPPEKAVQFETFGPTIQGNPMGATEVDGWAFNYWDIETKQYLPCSQVDFMPTVKEVSHFEANQGKPNWQEWAKLSIYSNGKPAEGIVIRPVIEHSEFIDAEYRRFSFKVINTLYEN